MQLIFTLTPSSSSSLKSSKNLRGASLFSALPSISLWTAWIAWWIFACSFCFSSQPFYISPLLLWVCKSLCCWLLMLAAVKCVLFARNNHNKTEFRHGAAKFYSSDEFSISYYIFRAFSSLLYLNLLLRTSINFFILAKFLMNFS